MGAGGSVATGGLQGGGGRAPGAGGTIGSGGAAGALDAGVGDGARDVAIPTDAMVPLDTTVVCSPNHPVGTVVPLGDGCNTCVCQPTGAFACTTASCPPANDPGTDTASEAGGASDGERDAALDFASGDAGTTGCDAITDQTVCEARTDCHLVFEDPGNCNCLALGCCARFKACAVGALADCTGPAACKMMEPFCEGPYVVAHAGSCYEGCARKTDCAF